MVLIFCRRFFGSLEKVIVYIIRSGNVRFVMIGSRRRD